MKKFPGTKSGDRLLRHALRHGELLEEGYVRHLLKHWGEDPKRDGLRDTPIRYLSAMGEMLSGNKENPASILGKIFKDDYDQMIVVPGIPFTSLCEHHLFPFSGHASIGYIPKGKKVVGLSKLPRLLQCFAHRLQIQERLTQQVAHAIQTHLKPIGVGVLITANHTCMSGRGVRIEAPMITSCLLGAMRKNGPVRQEFLALSYHG